VEHSPITNLFFLPFFVLLRPFFTVLRRRVVLATLARGEVNVLVVD